FFQYLFYPFVYFPSYTSCHPSLYISLLIYYISPLYSLFPLPNMFQQKIPLFKSVLMILIPLYTYLFYTYLCFSLFILFFFFFFFFFFFYFIFFFFYYISLLFIFFNISLL